MGWEQRARHAAARRRDRRRAAVSRDASRGAGDQFVQHARPAARRSGWLMPAPATSAAGYDGKDVKGAVVLVSGPLAPAWQQAVRARGAAGVISTDLARYTRPDETPDVLQWGNIPFDEALKSFGFKATPRVGRAPARRARQRAGHRSRGHRDDVPSPAEPDAGRSRFPDARGRSSGWCWPPTCRSRAPTTTPAAAARCWPPRSASTTRIRRGALPAPARTHHVSLGGRDSRQRAVDQGPRRARQATWWRCCRST